MPSILLLLSNNASDVNPNMLLFGNYRVKLTNTTYGIFVGQITQLTLQRDGNTITWYATVNASYQFNSEGLLEREPLVSSTFVIVMTRT